MPTKEQLLEAVDFLRDGAHADESDYAVKALRQFIEQSPAQPEPTPEMLEAARKRDWERWDCQMPPEHYADLYRAMAGAVLALQNSGDAQTDGVSRGDLPQLVQVHLTGAGPVQAQTADRSEGEA